MAAPPPNNMRANSLAEQRFQGYDNLDFLTNNVKPNNGTFGQAFSTGLFDQLIRCSNSN